MIPRFIVIDDEPTNNMISRMVIKRFVREADVKEFTDPVAALDYISSQYSDSDKQHTIVFLDINMPQYSGWDFLIRYQSFKSGIKNQLKIFMLSSSIDERDLIMAKQIDEVEAYLEKPLTIENVADLVSQYLDKEGSLVNKNNR